MSLLTYSDYKDSGIAWLGKIPSHWEICALKRVAALKSGDGITAEQIREEGEYPVYGGNGLRGYTSSFTHEGRFALVGRQGALCGNVNYSDGKFWASEHAVVAIPVKAAQVTWLGELLRTMNLNQYSVSAAQPGLSVEIISNLAVPYPPPNEQSAIAAFLDRETSKIDTLIAEQEKLLTLLAEKRQATISHAVTRGLNPDVLMKDSGVAWLGEVPAHWKITRIKRLVASIEQGWSPQCENFPVEGAQEWGVMKVGCVNGGAFNASENKKLPLELTPIPAYSLRSGDLLISRANTRELVGSAAVVPRDFENLLLCDKLYRLRTNLEACMPEFLAAFLSIPAARAQIKLEATGASSSMLNIAQSVILELSVPLPEITEQSAIKQFINAETNKFDALKSKAEHAIDLLKERRSALIAAAVTGKIDVRNAVPEELAA
ncbi:TPA: restriction endonuclease subunit S [Burkholderia stabilis]|nr:restriction endonuclease subunit S [Burkholderia stabilis]HDR9653374.1 restriction endonuclease subunit S [Burkholderia stabilis]HDR9660208.1 restriction endonuclease subunit S [Burkholderia stabilis]HDR9683828.1 restriction endonuclease subunit S [Burkholderia stabilis]